MNKTSAIIFFGIILLGLALSLLYFNRGPGEPEPSQEPADSLVQAEAEPEAGKGPARGAPEGATAAAAGETASSPARQEDGTFESPAAALGALREALSERTFDAVLELVGPEAVPGPAAVPLRSLVEASDFSLDSEPPFREVSKSADASRWAINFVPEAGGAARQLYVDLETVEGGRVAFSGLSLPLELPTAAAARGGEAAAAGGEAASDPLATAARAVAAALLPGTDALTVAHAFSKAVVERNFPVARALADPASITDERVAALMIAVEEGGFALREDRPFVVTYAREDLTMVIARIQSPDAGSEFALELGRSGEAWKIDSLTFSKVLSALASKAGGGDVAYSPIVENPAGGDSLVLYFEFDEAGINERGMRQLSVIADILKQGEERVIRINGHADAMGSDRYNKVLSDRRAGAIREGLLSFGVSPRQVVTEAFGDTRPRRPNFNPDGSDNPSGRSENRRAEVYLDF